MPVDFEDPDCQDKTNAAKFGLCDDEKATPARISYNTKEKWNATVINQNNTDIVFIAVDHCILKLDKNGNRISSCDCILSYPLNIIFVELKNKGSDWISEGIRQLRSSIKLYKDHANISSFRKRRAVVANRKHPSFHKIENETMQRFYAENKVRLLVGSEIKI